MSLVLRTASRTEDERQEAIEFLNTRLNSYESIGALWADSEFVYKAGELVRQLATDQFMITDPTDLFFRRVPGPQLGDWVEIEEFVNTAKVVQRSLGGKPRVFTPHKNKYTYEMEDWRLDFGFELEKVATGQIDVSVWVDQIAEATSRFFVSEALDTVDTAVASGVQDAYSRDVRTTKSGDVNEATVDTAIRRLGDVNQDMIIAGRYHTLFPIFDITNGASEIALEEFRQRGGLARYKGATIVVLRDNYNPFFQAAEIPSDRIYLAGSDKGGILAETDMSSMNYNVVDQEEQHFRVGIKGRTSFNIFKPWRYHVIELT